MPSCVEVSQAIEQYCDVRTVTSEQYVEMRDSPQSRDADDVKKLVSWLNFRSPHSEQTTQLISRPLAPLVKMTRTAMRLLNIVPWQLLIMLGKNFA